MIELRLTQEEGVQFAFALGEGASALTADIQKYRKGGASTDLIEIVTKARDELDVRRNAIEEQFDKPETHHHSHHPGEYRPFGYDTTWCSSCDRPIDKTKVEEHACRPDEIGRPCSYKGDPS